jgi:hypothetical protein
MRFLLFIILFFNGCASKVAKSLSKKPDTGSIKDKSDVFNIAESTETYNHQDPLIWFGIIILIVLLSAIIPLIFKKCIVDLIL